MNTTQKVDKYEPFYNSVIALGADAKGLYKKQNLYPWANISRLKVCWLGIAKFDERYHEFSQWLCTPSALASQNHPVGVAICYEVAIPIPPAAMPKIPTFYWPYPMMLGLAHRQVHYSIYKWCKCARLKPVAGLCATNTGVTAIINDKGNIVAKAPAFERTVLRGEIQSRVGNTPFMRWVVILSWHWQRYCYWLVGWFVKHVKTLDTVGFCHPLQNLVYNGYKVPYNS